MPPKWAAGKKHRNHRKAELEVELSNTASDNDLATVYDLVRTLTSQQEQDKATISNLATQQEHDREKINNLTAQVKALEARIAAWSEAQKVSMGKGVVKGEQGGSSQRETIIVGHRTSTYPPRLESGTRLEAGGSGREVGERIISTHYGRADLRMPPSLYGFQPRW